MQDKNLTAAQAAALERRDKMNIQQLETEVRNLKRAVTGFNGDTGLCGRVENVEGKIDSMKISFDKVHVLLIGDEEDPASRGMKGEQQELKKMQTAVKRILWIAIGAIVSSSVGILFVLAQLTLAASP